MLSKANNKVLIVWAGTAILSTLVGLIVAGGLIHIAFHFITKYW